MELTIQQACVCPQDFMYIWADEKKFLQYIDKTHAAVIRSKKANQNKLLTLSAQKYGHTQKEYTDAIRAAFVEQFKMTPAEALVILAQGGQVAGKNWDEGVYGIGALNVSTFTGHAEISVRPEDGHILNNGVDATDTTKTVYATIKKQAVPYQLFATINGVTYMSQYNKTLKKYYAQTYSTAEGQFSARTGNSVNASDNADIWGAILSSFEKFITWLISLFGGSTTTMLSAENTLPNQTADGFVQEAGMSDAVKIALVLAAGGALLTGGLKKSKK